MTGLKVGFSTAVPDSFSFGFKRKEYSFISVGPVVTKYGSHDVYPSVLASIDTGEKVSTTGEIDKTALSSSQFFATGRAARKLAANYDVNKAFRKLATQSLRAKQEDMLDEYISNDEDENKLVEEILALFKKQDETKESIAKQKEMVKLANESGSILLEKVQLKAVTKVNLEYRLRNFQEDDQPKEVHKLKALTDLKNEITSSLAKLKNN